MEAHVAYSALRCNPKYSTTLRTEHYLQQDVGDGKGVGSEVLRMQGRTIQVQNNKQFKY